MKQGFLYFLLITAVLYAGLSCQKELSGDSVGNAEGTLDTDIDGDCLPMGVFGPFLVNGNLSDRNYIEAPVTVTRPGAYSMQTNTVNGFSFKANGSFSTMGSYKVKLPGTGKPITAGLFEFDIMFGTSTCKTTVIVNTDTATSGPAEFSFAGAPGTCLGTIVSGEFIKGKLLDSTNSITIKMNVTRTGSYNLSTTSVNGYRFTGFGSLNAIGAQTIKLTATGTPLLKGIGHFTFNSSISSCSFPVEVKENSAVTNNDHFPLTAKSFWNYDDLLNPGDTIKRTITDSVQVGGTNYKRMTEQYKTGAPQEFLFRKTGNDYFEYGSVDKYTSVLSFVPSINAPIPFLKENLSTGDIWKTVEYTGISVSTGKSVMLQYVFNCTDADANISINGVNYQHVYNVTMTAQTRPDASVPYEGTKEINDLFYAKGIGLVYAKKTNQGFNRIEIKIRNWQVE